MKTTISRETHHRITELAYKLQFAIEDGSTWEGITAVEDGLAEIIEAEAKRMAGVQDRNAYFERLGAAKTVALSKYASVAVLREQHARVAHAAAKREQPMSRVVGDLIDENL